MEQKVALKFSIIFILEEEKENKENSCWISLCMALFDLISLESKTEYELIFPHIRENTNEKVYKIFMAP